MRLVIGFFIIIISGAGILYSLNAEQDMTRPDQPNKYHKFLEQFAGEWNAVSEWVMEPGKPPVTSKGHEKAKMINNGLWLKTKYEEEGPMGKLSGMGLMGYDLRKGKFVMCWTDSMTSFLHLMEGTCNKDGTVFTMVFEGPCPQTGKDIKMKMVSEIVDKDTRTMTFYMIGDDGSENLTGSIKYTRKEAETSHSHTEVVTVAIGGMS